MGNQKAVFIINPKAGLDNKKGIASAIKATLSVKLNYDILYWESPSQDVSSMAKKAAEEGADIVVAVGGDGTVNAIAKGLIGTNASLAIIPIGSGNGLARHLGIPIHIEKSIQLLATGKSIPIDHCTINGHPFFCTSGMGFDAHIGKLFSQVKKRGFITYFKLTLRELFNYKPQSYELTIDGKKTQTRAFLVTFANANQWGNNTFIAPMADIRDGIIEVCILKPVTLIRALSIGRKLFNRTIATSPSFEHHRGKHILVHRQSAGPVHYDGEPDEMGTSLEIQNFPQSLNVIVPGN